MRFNPFEEKPMPLDQLFMDWDKLYPKPYHLGTVHRHRIRSPVVRSSIQPSLSG